MSIPSDIPISYCYVHFTDEVGAEHIRSLIFPHDGALQASDEAVRRCFPDELPLHWRIRQVDVFTNVQPRRFYHQSVVKRTFQMTESR